MSGLIKVAAYCRVSTDYEDQINSFLSQKQYFQEYIRRQEGWELYCIYADEGITGTNTKRRSQFKQMIAEAYKGKFQMIITKEVSRFSRNILDTISYTRELKSMGVGVLFVTDGIYTMEPDAELRLSIMASIAQEESRKTSARVKWGQTRQMERGVVFGHSMLGYEVKNGVMDIEPVGAEIVRLIFQKYGIEKKGVTVIARELQQAGYHTYSGSDKWTSSHILKILKNEKYAGDLIQKKSYTPDYLTHEKKVNRGEEKLITIRNHHESIIERPLWDLVQEEISKRKRDLENRAKYSDCYVFSGKIKCGECGASFVARRKTLNSGTVRIRWSCYKAVREGRKRCDLQGNEVGCDVGRLLRNDEVWDAEKQALVFLEWDKRTLINGVATLAADVICADLADCGKLQRRYEIELDQVNAKITAVLDAYFAGEITVDEMQSAKKRYEEQRIRTHRQLKEVCKSQESYEEVREKVELELNRFLTGESKSEALYRHLLQRITVHKDRHIELSLINLSMVFYFQS